jgi:mono/diheme cytochrome c family protein
MIVLAMLSRGVLIAAAGSASAFAQQGNAVRNPVPPDQASIAVGRKLFTSNCASCHGESGKGDGKSAAALDPKPSDLTDATWKHGQSDGEIYTLIRTGAKQTSMRGYAGRMTAQEIWSLVNFLRTLGPSSNRLQ